MYRSSCKTNPQIEYTERSYNDKIRKHLKWHSENNSFHSRPDIAEWSNCKKGNCLGKPTFLSRTLENFADSSHLKLYFQVKEQQ